MITLLGIVKYIYKGFNKWISDRIHKIELKNYSLYEVLYRAYSTRYGAFERLVIIIFSSK